MHRGYIKLWRKSFDSGLHKDCKTWLLWTYILCHASYKEIDVIINGKKIKILPGQMVTGRKALAKALSVSEQNIRTCLSRLETYGNLTIKSTNRYSIISVINWALYQEDDRKTNQQTNQQVTSNQPASNHKQEGKERKNKDSCPHKAIVDLYHEVLPELPKVRAWTQKRMGNLNARWREKFVAPSGRVSNTLEFWKGFFEFVKEKDFLMGRVPSRNGSDPFKANLPWIIEREHFYKIIEDFYR